MAVDPRIKSNQLRVAEGAGRQLFALHPDASLVGEVIVEPAPEGSGLPPVTRYVVRRRAPPGETGDRNGYVPVTGEAEFCTQDALMACLRAFRLAQRKGVTGGMRDDQ